MLTLKAMKNEEKIAAHSGTLEKFPRKQMFRIDKHETLRRNFCVSKNTTICDT